MNPGERRIGRHTLRAEPPDTVLAEIVGDVAPDEIHEIHAELTELSQAGSILFIINIARLGRMPAASRAASARWPHLKRLRAIAIFGAGFEQRVVATLVLKAVGLLSKDFNAAAAFFATEAEARVWLEAPRRPP